MIINLELGRLSRDNAVVQINASVAADQTLGEIVPCGNVSFPVGDYEIYKPKSNPNKSKKYAGDEIGKKFNQKIENNHCIFYTQVTTVTLPTFQVSSKTINEEKMLDAYCFFKEQLSKMVIPPGFSISAVVVTGDLLVCNTCGGKLTMKVSIGIKNVKPNCDPRYPPMPPIEL